VSQQDEKSGFSRQSGMIFFKENHEDRKKWQSPCRTLFLPNFAPRKQRRALRSNFLENSSAASGDIFLLSGDNFLLPGDVFLLSGDVFLLPGDVFAMSAAKPHCQIA